MKSEIRDCLHVMGHLLETNGTVGKTSANKYNEAILPNDPDCCKWCLIGAREHVVRNCFPELNPKDVREALLAYLNTENLILTWDHAGTAGRKEIVEKLKNA